MTVVYRFADGSRVVVDTAACDDGPMFTLYLASGGRKSVVHDLANKWMDPWVHEADEEDSVEAHRMMRAFLLDLGVPRPSTGRTGSLVYTTEGEACELVYPKWVPDDVWARRLDLAKPYIYHFDEDNDRVYGLDEIIRLPPYLGFVSQFRLEWLNKADRHTLRALDELDDELGRTIKNGRTPPQNLVDKIKELQILLMPKRIDVEDVADFPLWEKDGRWEGRWSTYEVEGNTFVETIHAVMQHECLMPESSRESWDRDNIEWGEFVVPSPAEVELYRALGEPLPLLWDSSALFTWLSERVVTTSDNVNGHG